MGIDATTSSPTLSTVGYKALRRNRSERMPITKRCRITIVIIVTKTIFLRSIRAEHDRPKVKKSRRNTRTFINLHPTSQKLVPSCVDRWVWMGSCERWPKKKRSQLVKLPAKMVQRRYLLEKTRCIGPSGDPSLRIPPSCLESPGTLHRRSLMMDFVLIL